MPLPLPQQIPRENGRVGLLTVSSEIHIVSYIGTLLGQVLDEAAGYDTFEELARFV